MSRPMVMPGGEGSREDAWIQTFTGRQFFPWRPDDSEVVIEDIAHHLAGINRFTGATRVPYNVAQHSVIVSQLVPLQHALRALLHDGSEAYLNDMASPVKAGMDEYRELEAVVQIRILREFGLVGNEPQEVKHADLVAVATEARDLMANPPTMWKLPVAAFTGMVIEPWDAARSEREFLARFRELTK